MSEISKCNRCGAPLTPDSPEGLCPRCLVALNLATQTEITGETASPEAQPKKRPFMPPLPIDEVAKLFPQLEILECLGRGGMGAVYKARQPRLDRIVALKILSPEKQSEPKFAERFEREARALAKLHHPNIVTIYDFGEAQGNFYLLMEFVDGLTLRQLIQARKLSPAEALGIVPKICEALQYAHEQGIVHRDIKPENILLDKNGQLKIADFGIAKILGDSGRENLTAKQIIGTPHYMSPEQIEKPQTVDHRADIYSLGVVFYEMLTGELPLGKFSPPSKKVQIDVRLDEIILRALEKEPALRYQQASEVKTHVETIAQSQKSEAGSQKLEIEPRFSRMAIAGICWLAIFVALGLPAPAFVFFPILIFGFFGTMILGWIAVSQIRHSAEKLYGTWLAVFDGLLFPLLLLDGIIFGLLFLFFQLAGDRIFPNSVNGDAISIGINLGYQIALRQGVWIGFGILLSGIIDFFVTRRVWHAVNRPIPTAPPVQKPDHFWRWFAVMVLALITIPFFISIVGMLAAIVIPNFVKARQHALALHEQQIAATNFFIGQTWFPQGDSIEITSVERNENQMTVRGFYNLVSHDQAEIALYITTTNNADNAETNVPESFNQMKPAFKGRRAFALMCSNSVPGLPHVSMYAGGHSFASIYFGNKEEAAQERQVNWITNAAPIQKYGQRLVAIIKRGSTINPATGLPISPGETGGIDPATGLPTTVGGAAKINPVTGLPMSPGQTEEIDPNTGLPVTPVAKSDASQILAGQPPVVVETFPVSGARDVEPGETEIRVRFSKPMENGSWSWSTAWENSTPEFIGQPHYEADLQTCVAKVKLEPDKTYAFWLNSENFHNFKDAANRPAIPYLLIFHTKQN